MAITVVKRPIGVRRTDSSNTATVSDSSGALFTNTSHGLVDGDYVYVDSDIEDYNGFYYVDQQDSNTFKLRDNTSNGDILPFVITGSVTYYKGYSHVWSAINLPIVYELSNDRYPTNSVDTAQTITSHSDDSSYTSISFGSSLSVDQDYSHVKISGASPSTLDGVYRVIEKTTSTQNTIDLPYDVTNNFSAATVQVYYKNYVVNVEVWAGLEATEPFASKKPMELIATLKLTPDSSNRVLFSISELLKQKIAIENNPLQASMPLDLNAFTQFYINYNESYDYLTIYDLIDTKDKTPNTDSFVGVAMDSDLPFKNQYSGHMSDYVYTAAPVYTDDLLSRFLTGFTTLIAWTSQFFELCFIKPRPGALIVDVNGSTTNYADNGIGVYRIPITITGSQLCVTVHVVGVVVEPPASPTLIDIQDAGASSGQLGTGSTWSYDNTNHWNSDPAAFQSTKVLYFEITGGLAGYEYQFPTNFDAAGAGTLRWRLYDETLTDVIEKTTTVFSAANYDRTGTFTPSFIPKYIGVMWGLGGAAGLDIKVHTMTMSVDTGGSTSYPTTVLTEQKCITVNTDCCDNEIVLVWKNYLGGYDRWKFCGTKEYQIDIKDATEQAKNILPNWPKSFGDKADTIRRHTRRTSANKIVFRSQNLTEDQRDALKYIKVSPLVQIETSKKDRRTILIDTDSFKVYDEKDKLYAITFTGEYTDFLPSQKA